MCTEKNRKKRQVGNNDMLPTCLYICFSLRKSLLHLAYDSLESLGVVHCEVGEHLAVDLDASLVKVTHQLRVAHAFETSGSVDTLNPQCTEGALLVTTVAVCIGQTFLPSVFGNGPHILAGSEIATRKLKNSLSFCS